MGGAVARLIDEAVNMLLDDCEDLSLTYPSATARVIIESYINLFSNFYAGLNDRDVMDVIIMCEAKVVQLNPLIDYNIDTIDIPLYFKRTVSARCNRLQNAHELCERSWRYNVFDFVALVVSEMDIYFLYNNNYPYCFHNIYRGMLLYSVAKYTQAEEKLCLALKDDSMQL